MGRGPQYIFKDDAILIVERDENPPNPRDWDNIGIMVCTHPRYYLRDKSEKHGYSQGDFGNWIELEEQISRDHPGSVILPLYRSDGDGLGISPRPGYERVGVIFTHAEKLSAAGFDPGKLDLDRVRELLLAEVRVYDQFLRGDVFGFILYGPPCERCGSQGGEEDSCWGFFGSDPFTNGMLQYLPAEYQSEMTEGRIKG